MSVEVHNHEWERLEGVLCCPCGAWVDDRTPPGAVRYDGDEELMALMEVRGAAVEQASPPVNARSAATSSPKVVTKKPKAKAATMVSGFCNPTSPRREGYDPHARCRMPICGCGCHRGVDVEDVAERMEQFEICPDCRQSWDRHDFDDERVYCRECRR